MAVIEADGATIARGRRFSWTGSYDTAAHELVFEAKLVDAGTGLPVDPLPGEDGGAELIQQNGQVRRLDAFDPPAIVNQGPQTYSVNLKVSTVGRWTGFEVHSWYTAPTG